MNTALYTLGGVLSSVLAGLALGAFGAWLVPERLRTAAVAGLLAVAAVAALREAGWLRLPLPQPLRQTSAVWPRRFGAAKAAAFWGFDLGLIVTSRFTFAGIWVLVLFPVATGNAALGAAATLAYWGARAFPAWTAPLLMTDANAALGLLDAVNAREDAFRRAHILGIAFIMTFLILSIT